jgi:hypothetical protein
MKKRESRAIARFLYSLFFILYSSTRPAFEDDALSADDRAAIDRALAEPGIALTADALAELLAGLDDEVRELLAQPARSAFAAGRVAEALGVARFNAFEQQHPFAQRDQVARQRGA